MYEQFEILLILIFIIHSNEIFLERRNYAHTLLDFRQRRWVKRHPQGAQQILRRWKTRRGMHNEDLPLGSNVTPILVAAQCYWKRKFREFLPLRRNSTYDFVVHTTQCQYYNLHVILYPLKQLVPGLIVAGAAPFCAVWQFHYTSSLRQPKLTQVLEPGLTQHQEAPTSFPWPGNQCKAPDVSMPWQFILFPRPLKGNTWSDSGATMLYLFLSLTPPPKKKKKKKNQREINDCGKGGGGEAGRELTPSSSSTLRREIPPDADSHALRFQPPSTCQPRGRLSLTLDGQNMARLQLN